MMAILDQIATGGLAFGMLAIVIGSFVAISIAIRITIAQPDFWDGQWGGFHKRMLFRSRVGALARKKENTTRSGRLADWFLKCGTILLIVGGVVKLTLFFIEIATP